MLLLKKFYSTSDFGFIHRWATPIRSFGGISCPDCRAICMLLKDKVALSHKAEISSKFYDLVGGPVVQQQETTPWKVRISWRYQPNMPTTTNAPTTNQAFHTPQKHSLTS